MITLQKTLFDTGVLHHDTVRDNFMFSIEIISVFNATEFNSKQSYYKQNLTLVVISCEIYETHQILVS